MFRLMFLLPLMRLCKQRTFPISVYDTSCKHNSTPSSLMDNFKGYLFGCTGSSCTHIFISPVRGPLVVNIRTCSPSVTNFRSLVFWVREVTGPPGFQTDNLVTVHFACWFDNLHAFYPLPSHLWYSWDITVLEPGCGALRSGALHPWLCPQHSGLVMHNTVFSQYVLTQSLNDSGFQSHHIEPKARNRKGKDKWSE